MRATKPLSSFLTLLLLLLASTPGLRAQSTAAWWEINGRDCDGCPPRRPGHALLQTTFVNGLYGLVNLARGQESARISPRSWLANMKNGWVWDLDDFLVNQLGHPYQGNNYFTSARANGLSFWESWAVAAFGSATWEYFGETNKPSLNDFVNTTLGGIALGEVFHRTAWLVREPGGPRKMSREVIATAIDPMTGFNRVLSGDFSNTSGKPRDLHASKLGALVAVGLLWRDESSQMPAVTKPFVEVNMRYGDPETGRSRTPYDAFLIRLRVGGGSAVSEARVRGRLAGQPIGGKGLHLSASQSYDFSKNGAYEFGAQSFEANVAATRTLSSRLTFHATGWGGTTVLGAVDSVPLDAPPQPTPTVLVSSRTFDYGPGTTFGAAAALYRDGLPFATATVEGRHIFVVDGVRANHLLHRVRVDLVAPLRGTVRVGVTGEYFGRHTYYKDADRTELRVRYPQLSVSVAWGIS